jgi:hypothetical protein
VKNWFQSLLFKMQLAPLRNGGQTEIWYTRLLRDEVLAEWREDGLHVHCNVSVEGHWRGCTS